MKEEMIEHTINGIAELVYEDEIKEAEASLEYYANQRVIEELNSIANFCQGATEEMIYKAVADRIQELKQD
jgi:3,4-dihydroxy-2-butanone 4-phosphate synthase